MLTVVAFPWWIFEWNHSGTPIIAIITVSIAVQQYRLDRRQYRLALFERRLAVFNRVMSMMTSVLGMTEPKLAENIRFIRDTRDHELLFGKEIGALINEIYKKAKALRVYLVTDYSGSVGKQTEIIDWFVKQMEEAPKLFRKYLDFTRP
jgi:phosphoenolpyruvate carboxylase